MRRKPMIPNFDMFREIVLKHARSGEVQTDLQEGYLIPILFSFSPKTGVERAILGNFVEEFDGRIDPMVGSLPNILPRQFLKERIEYAALITLITTCTFSMGDKEPTLELAEEMAAIHKDEYLSPSEITEKLEVVCGGKIHRINEEELCVQIASHRKHGSKSETWSIPVSRYAYKMPAFGEAVCAKHAGGLGTVIEKVFARMGGKS